MTRTPVSRRAMGLALAALGTHLGNTTERLPDGSSGWTRLRRVVISDDPAGRAVVLADGEPSNATVLNGTRITRLWEAAAVPAKLPLKADAGAAAGNAYRDGFRGASFYVAELPGGARAPVIPMHRNETLDFMAILSGQILLQTPEQDITLKGGDTLVLGGSEHSWVNRWEAPCLLLFVVLVGTRTGA